MSLKTISLHDLVVSRTLLGVEIDDSIPEVIGKLGEPEHHQHPEGTDPEWLLYGDLQLCFISGRLDYFGLNLPENFSTEVLYGSLRLHNDIHARLDLGVIQKVLNLNKVEFLNDPIGSDEAGVVLVTEREVHMSIPADDVIIRIVVSDFKKGYYRRYKSGDYTLLR